MSLGCEKIMELTIEQALQRAIEAHKAGKLQDAEALYRAILQTQPKHPDANHNLGVIAVSLNKTEAAIPLFKIALEANPNQGQFWLSYLDALINEKNFEVANYLLQQGKKRGLSGEKADVLAAKLTAIILAQNSEFSSNNKIPNFIQHNENVSIKKEKKENLPKNLVHMNQTRGPLQIEINTVIDHYKKGEYELAEILAKTQIEQYPNHPFGWKVLGALSKQIGKLQDSLIANQKVLEISPNDAGAHSNLGITFKELGRLEDAETSYKRAIAIKPNLAEARYNLGITLQELGRLKDAEISYKKAIAIKPDYAEAYSNLGITQKELGRLEDAESSFKKAIAIKPDYAEAHYNLGITLQELGRIVDALIIVIKSIKIKPTAEAKNLFVLLTKEITIQTWNQSLVELVITALLEPWGRPSDVMPIACRLLKMNKEFLRISKESKNDIYQSNYCESFLDLFSKKEFSASALIQAMLSSSAIPDAEIEICLTSLRRHFLNIAESVTLKDVNTDGVNAFYCSLAEQCFINEYVYFQTQEEIRLSYQLCDRLIQALEDKQTVPEVWVIAVACYFPLYSIVKIEILHQQKWTNDVKSIFKQQIQESLNELNLRASIPVLTNIDNLVSLAVQSQYEENPYPRWMRLSKKSNKKFLNSYIQSKFPLSPFRRLLDDRNLEILIAGCGTGQISIGTSNEFKGAKILAIDLSMASLAYAKRKTTELDIEFIDYAQADLLKLASLSRTFDVIESSGVLHHIEDPFEGWKVLLSLLRPQGLMRLGFYSALARRDIVRVRNLISSAGIGSSSQDIRSYRKHLLELKDFENYGFATSSSDFFSTSACRDLLFHVQEHRMNLKILADFIKDHDLNFLGFDISSSVIRAYKKRFPNDPSGINLDQWHIYEEENPNTFIGMYQFWIQKNISQMEALEFLKI
jgi:tetratricopeptide (TPR) repeat protein/2-polyprenyl-3-methyl-5-hydroxy-6-metoxy-1,4-benzoquinol methylase